MINEVITLLCPINAAPGRGAEMQAALRELAAATVAKGAKPMTIIMGTESTGPPMPVRPAMKPANEPTKTR